MKSDRAFSARARSLYALSAVAAALAAATACSAQDGQEKNMQEYKTRPAVEYSLPEVKVEAPLEPNEVGIYGLEHTHVITGDIDKCIEFYVDILGFHQVTPVRDIGKDGPMNEMLGFGGKASFRTAMLAMPGGASYGKHVPGIEIWEVTGVPLDKTLYNSPAMNLQGKGYNSYRVKDLGALIKKLDAAGIKFVSKQIFLTPEISGIYAIDPDGQIVEFDQFPKPFGEQ
jgi:catechol 2,3-dioxygenase-like lactoylglutathione lyase family enzyme